MGHICSVDGCTDVIKSKAEQLCNMHYRRLLKYGDVGSVESIKARSGEPLYWLFNIALFYRNKRQCLIWPFARVTGGYGTVQYKGKMRSVHRLLCRKIHGKPPSKEHEGCHSCGKGHEGCVNPHHLYWGTAKQNARDRAKHGMTAKGSNLPFSKLTERLVIKIRKLRERGWSSSQLAVKFSVSKTTIKDVLSNRTWKHVERQ